MHATKDLKKFERKNGTIVLQSHGGQYIITTAQRIRMDLVWATESVRSTLADAMQLFLKHKQCIQTNGHCIGDNTHLR